VNGNAIEDLGIWGFCDLGIWTFDVGVAVELPPQPYQGFGDLVI
jgi:hypothetical protein